MNPKYKARKRRFCQDIALLIALVCFPTWGEEDAEFEIQFHRAHSVGDEHHWVVNGTLIRETADLIHGVRTEQTKRVSNYHIEGVSTVQAIDETGQPQKVDFRVSTLTLRGDGTKPDVEVLPKDAVLTSAYDNGKILFWVDGEEASEEVVAHVGSFFNLPPPGVTMDEIWGVKERKRVQDSWSADTELLTKQFAASGIEINQERIKTRMTLRNATTTKGIPILEFQWDLHVPESNNMHSPDQDSKIEANFHEKGTLVIHQDPHLNTQHQITEMIFESKIDYGYPDEKLWLRIQKKIERTVSPVSEETPPKP
ncbi:MAG: hypothetical protein JJU29_17325 [Verrucomicrobia bacterium]|nr:hypothetical protein [Verrucomicrobiota bacterium]MCH8510074.1 hypothetical protein [Kiritimatiellia bacterium]